MCAWHVCIHAGSLFVKDKKDKDENDFTATKYDQGTAVVMSPYVVHRVSPPVHKDRVVIGIFW
jgi:hypothetical protein